MFYSNSIESEMKKFYKSLSEKDKSMQLEKLKN